MRQDGRQCPEIDCSTTSQLRATAMWKSKRTAGGHVLETIRDDVRKVRRQVMQLPLVDVESVESPTAVSRGRTRDRFSECPKASG